jgi:polyisoprenoid-binding protein YceI
VTNLHERPAIDLHIHGKGLLLSGTFGGWQSRLVLGPDLDDVGVSLFVDSTSVAAGRDVDTSDKLFSFRSRSVESLGRGRYRVIGDFTGADETRELALDVETPLGHTPLIAVSFAAEKKDFGEGYEALVENATLFSDRNDDESPRPEAAAWLVAPEVASA